MYHIRDQGSRSTFESCGPRMAREYGSLLLIIRLPGGDVEDIMTRTGGGFGLLIRRVMGGTRPRG